MAEKEGTKQSCEDGGKLMSDVSPKLVMQVGDMQGAV
jgi:hypothetical protein